MNICKAIDPYIADYLDWQNKYSFKEEQVEVYEVQNQGYSFKATLILSPSYRDLVPNEIRNSPKKAIRWLLCKGYAPVLKDKEVSFVLDATTTPVLKRLFAACDKAIQQLHTLLIESDDSIDEDLICPITHLLFEDPVMDINGHTFEKSAIEAYLKTKNACPLGQEPINLPLKPNR